MDSLKHLPLHAHVCMSAILHLQPAASSLFEWCYLISIIFKALTFSNLTRNWISMPAVSQHLSPLYLLCFPACSPGCLCCSGRGSLLHFWQIRSMKLNLAKLLWCQRMYQGTDWGFSYSPTAAFCWGLLALPVAKWNGVTGKAIVWHWGAFIHHPPLPQALWGALSPESPMSCLKWEGAGGGSEHHQGPGISKGQSSSTLSTGLEFVGLHLPPAGMRCGLSGSEQELPPVPCQRWRPCWGRFAINPYPFTSQAVRAKPWGYWKMAFRCVILFFWL